MDKLEKEKIQLGAILRKARKALGMTQTEVAIATDLSTSYISMIERGQDVPSDAILKELAQLFDQDQATLEDLLCRSHCIQHPEKAHLLGGPPISTLSSWIEQVPYEEIRTALKEIQVLQQNGQLSDETIHMLGRSLLLDLKMLAQPRPNVDLLLSQVGTHDSENSPMQDENYTASSEKEFTEEIRYPKHALYDRDFLDDTIRTMKDVGHNN